MQARRQCRRESKRTHEFFNRALTMLCGPRESHVPATSLTRLKQRSCRAERGSKRDVRPFFRITTLWIRNDRKPGGEWLVRRKTPSSHLLLWPRPPSFLEVPPRRKLSDDKTRPLFTRLRLLPSFSRLHSYPEVYKSLDISPRFECASLIMMLSRSPSKTKVLPVQTRVDSLEKRHYKVGTGGAQVIRSGFEHSRCELAIEKNKIRQVQTSDDNERREWW